MASTKPTRLGGRTELASGDVVMWSVADGRRGRRWRESGVRDGAVVRTILIETEPDCLIHRLEMNTAAGLLTLHPDASGDTLHGNVVTQTGMRHLQIGWGRDRAILLDHSPGMMAIALTRLGRDQARGERRVAEVLRIDDALVPVATHVDLTRLDSGTWQLSVQGDASAAVSLDLDDDGLIATPGRISWPLER